ASVAPALTPPTTPPTLPPPVRTVVSPIPSRTPPRPRPAARPSAAGSTVEAAVGGRWYAIAGAVIVMLGVGLGLKFAYDQGWMKHVTPAMRCLGGLVFGSGLLAAGILFRKRIGDWAAAGLLASGVGSLYATAWASYGLYQLVNNSAAFALLLAIVALGILTSALSGLVSVGVLSLLGGLLAPVLVSEGQSPPWIMGAHLLAMMTVGSAVAAWKRGKFAALRSIAWWGVVILGTFWAGDANLWREEPILILGFSALFWALVHGGMWLEFRTHAALAPDADDDHTSPAALTRAQAAAQPSARAFASSFSTTLWCVWMGVYAGNVSGLVEPWIVCAGYAAWCWLISMPMAGTLKLLHDVPSTDRERLGASLLLQVGGLIIGAVGLGLGGPAQTIAWFAMGVAAVLAGRWIRTTRLDSYGLVLLIIGSLRLFFERLALAGAVRPAGAAAPPSVDLAGLVLTEWSGLMLLAGVAWLLAARITQAWRTPGTNPHALIAGAMGVAAIALAPLSPGSEPASIAVWQGLWALAALGLSIVVGSPAKLRWWLDAVVFLGAGYWAFAYIDRWQSADLARVALHPGLMIALLLTASGATIAYINARARGKPLNVGAGTLSALLAVAVFFAASNLEVARLAEIATADQTSQRAAVSIWWALLSLILLAVGFARRWAWVRYAGLSLMAAAALKALIFDLADIGQGWRVISVLGVGLMMLAVAVLYGKLAARLSKPAEEDTLPGPDAEPPANSSP
ncbi:MAG: DUF2339 domain-containing protein, partial [Planctomycetota bacterium]|nr:DUF2339 domain-containing protein [Planctomycetota bacterium]